MKTLPNRLKFNEKTGKNYQKSTKNLKKG